MARILISEPHDQHRRLLVRMVKRLGHEPLAPRVAAPRDLRSADLFVLEPAAALGAALAQAAHLLAPTLPLICASVQAPPPALLASGIVFDTCLVKPFTLAQLGAAIEEALCRHGACAQSA
jgi:hypothetical protein